MSKESHDQKRKRKLEVRKRKEDEPVLLERESNAVGHQEAN